MVSDNDGAAFVTKAEFEALKENFAEQIEDYNTSIDSKIDGAIASYLAGIQLTKEQTLVNYVSTLYKTDAWATCFSDKSGNLGDSNNNDFVRGGWWIHAQCGWNTNSNTGKYETMLNITSGNLAEHKLAMYPSSTASYKWFLKKYSDGTNSYYGPYDATLYKMEEQVFVQKIDSVWNEWDDKRSKTRTTTGTTFDLTSLSASGTMDVGSFNNNWHTWTNIEGTIILSYNAYKSNNQRVWAPNNSIGVASSSVINYCLYYDDRLKLNSAARSESSIFKHSNSGCQAQVFQGVTNGGWYYGTAGENPITLKFKTPSILNLNNADLCNVEASKLIKNVVMNYHGLPITKIPQKEGKMKLKLKCYAYKISDGTLDNSVKSSVYFKIKPFKNVEIANEVSKDIVYKKENLDNDTEYTVEFDINDAATDGSTVLYVKCRPSSNTTYVRFELTEAPIWTG